MIITQDLFEKCIEDIKELEATKDALCTLGVDFLESSVLERIERDLVSFVENYSPGSESMKEIITWWMWENDFGRNKKFYSFYGNEYCFDTAAELYNFLWYNN